jgi:CheY-like chemotaxis protein
VRRLVEMHGGSIEAHSRGEGLGSRFVVRLPLNRAPEPDARGETKTLATPSVRRRVLVVDDNRDAADSLGMLLRRIGTDVTVVHDGAAALRALDACRPDVVLLDLGMPEMDGYSVARRIRERPEHRDVVLIALTGWGQEEDRRRTRIAGFDHHLTKPADLGALQALLA